MFVWFVLSWSALFFILAPTIAILQYTAAELLQLNFHLSDPLTTQYRCLDYARHTRRKYIHRGSRLSYHIYDSKTIQSIWSSTRHPSKNPTRKVDHSVIASLARSANANIQHDYNNVSLGLFNTRSLTGKGPLLQDLLSDRKFDFMCLTETWQQHNDFSQLNESTPPGFTYICKPRDSGRGGGLAIIYREKWKISPISIPCHGSFESIALQLNGPTPTIVATVYRPPKPNTDFINEFAAFLTFICSLSPNEILLGDFNIHMDNTTNVYTREFTSCLDSFGLVQHIKFPTHSKGHVLDLVCCSSVTPHVCTVAELPISDHMLISFKVNLTLSKIKLPRVISFRNIKDINLNTLFTEIDCLASINCFSNPEELVSHYNDGLQNILNSLAP